VPAAPAVLGDFEQLVLLAVLCARQDGRDAYGITIHAELERRAARRVARGAVYMTLDRLEKKGLLRSSASAPTAERGGRSRRCYAVTAPALAALRDSRRTLTRLWEGLPARGTGRT
jgi:DNA-binding PadR family transcriptional regulator